MRRVVLSVAESSYEMVMEKLKGLNFDDLGVKVERVSDTEFNLLLIELQKNPCADIPNLDCQYEGCEKTMIGFATIFGYRYCEDHRNISPIEWIHKESG